MEKETVKSVEYFPCFDVEYFDSKKTFKGYLSALCPIDTFAVYKYDAYSFPAKDLSQKAIEVAKANAFLTYQLLKEGVEEAGFILSNYRLEKVTKEVTEYIEEEY